MRRRLFMFSLAVTITVGTGTCAGQHAMDGPGEPAEYVLRGSIVEADLGKGLSNATVGLFPPGEENWAKSESAICEVTADEEGRFAIAIRGIAVLVGSAPGHARSARVVSFRDEQVVLELQRAVAARLEFSDCPFPYVIVLDAESFYHSTQLDEGCRAEFGTLAPGRLLVWMSDDGNTPIGSPHTLKPRTGAMVEEHVEVWGTVIEGTVLNDGIPMKDVPVKCRLVEALPSQLSTMTNEEGRFSVHEVKPGTWRVYAAADGRECSKELSISRATSVVVTLDFASEGGCSAPRAP